MNSRLTKHWAALASRAGRRRYPTAHCIAPLLAVTGTPYIVAYRIKGDQIDILAVLHAARKWPDGFKR
jgi:plasmid stabilization system protein ParE